MSKSDEVTGEISISSELLPCPCPSQYNIPNQVTSPVSIPMQKQDNPCPVVTLSMDGGGCLNFLSSKSSYATASMPLLPKYLASMDKHRA